MIYTSEQQIENFTSSRIDFPVLLDPAILKAAREIYQAYFEADPDRVPRPHGVAVDKYTHRGKIIFAARPILLPQECFVPFNQIESAMY